MRAGSARRRAHTAVGVATAVAAVLVSGSLVTDASGARPALASKGILDGSTSGPQQKETPPPPPPDPLTPRRCSTVQQVSAAIPGSWTEGPTSTNTAGDGLVFTCQGSRYADMHGIGALVRTFTGTAPKAPKGTKPPPGPLTAGQSAEASADEAAGRAHLQDHARLVRRMRESPGPAALDAPRRGSRRRGDAAGAPRLDRAGDHPGRRRGPHRRAHDHGRQHRHGDDRPEQGAGPRPERRAARHRGLRALHPAGRRQLRGRRRSSGSPRRSRSASTPHS